MRKQSTAIFVDFPYLQDNANGRSGPADAALQILQQLREHLEQDHSQILIRNVYADWEETRSSSIQRGLVSCGFVPKFVLAQQDGHGVALELSLDCLQLVLSRNDLDQVVLVAGSESYIPLIRRIKEIGTRVVLASMPEAVTPELLEAVEGEHWLNLNEMGAVEAGQSTRLEQEDKQPSRPYQPTEAALDRAMELVLEADRQYNHRGIYLGPFYKDWMNPALPKLSNSDRKRVLEVLVNEQAVVIRQKEDVFERDRLYSVVFPNRDHERYLRVKQGMEKEPGVG